MRNRRALHIEAYPILQELTRNPLSKDRGPPHAVAVAIVDNRAGGESNEP